MQGTRGYRKFWNVLFGAESKKNSRIAKIVGLYSVVGLISVLIGQNIVRATTNSFTFSEASSNYSFTASLIDYNSGVAGQAVLKTQSAGFVDDTQGEFEAGTLDGTQWNSGISKADMAAAADPPPSNSPAYKPASGSESGLTTLWHLDEGSIGTTTDSANSPGLSGTETGDTLTNPGKFTNARNFDGSTGANSRKILVTNTGQVNLGGANKNFTLAAWIRPNTMGTTNRTIIGKWENHTGATNRKQYRMFLTGASVSNCTVVKSLCFQTGSAGTTQTPSAAGTSAIDDSGSVWTFVAVTFTGGATTGTANMYVNGKLESTTASVPIPVTNTGDFTIGCSLTNNTSPYCAETFKGDIDEAMTFDRALSDAEIADLYGARKRQYLILHLDNNANDSSGFANNGSWSASAAYSTGKIGGATGAAQFNGSNYITAPAAASSMFNVTDDLTIEAWVKPNSTSGTQTLINSNEATAKFQMTLSGAYPTVYTANITTNTPVARTLTAKTSVSVGTWYHLAAVWNKPVGASTGTVSLYINGVLDNTAAYTGTVSSGNVNVRLGANSIPANYFANGGLMDEVVVSLRSKTADELLNQGVGYKRVATLGDAEKNATTAKPWNKIQWATPVAYGPFLGTESNLVHLYHLDDASTPASDGVSGSPINLTITNTTKHPGTFKNSRFFAASADQIGASGDTALSSMSAFSIEAWARFKNAEETVTNQHIFNIGTNDPSVLRNASERIEVYEANTLRITSGRSIADTYWHHYAITYATPNLTLYIDGVQDGQLTSLSSASSSNAALNIGDNGSGSDNFLGTIDEVAVFNTDQSANIANHYKQGKLQLQYLTRSCASTGCSGVNFKGPDNTDNAIAPTTSLPASQTKVALWHFDEGSWDGTNNEVVDTTTNVRHGTAMGGANTSSDALFMTSGNLIGKSAMFTGGNDAVTVVDSGSSDVLRIGSGQTLSIEAWIKMDEVQQDGATIVGKFCRTACNNGTASESYALEIASNQKLRLREASATAENSATTTTDGVVPVGAWTHIVVVNGYGSSSTKFYVNGTSAGTPSITATSMVYEGGTSGALYIGKDPTGTRPGFKGKIDDLAIYNTDLSSPASNITDEYARGNPTNFITASGADPGVDDNQYFQYKTFFLSDGSASPQLTSVSVTNSTYPSTNPSIETTSNNPIAFTTSLDSIAETSTLNGGAIKYNLKCVGVSCANNGKWRYYTGSAWADSNSGTGSYAQSNTAAELSNSVMAAFKTAEGSGDLYWRAYLHSNGEQLVQLDNIDITYNTVVDSVTLISPVSQNSPALIVGATLDVAWDTVGTWSTGGTVALEYTTNGVTFSALGAGTAAADQATGGCALGGHTGCYRTTVPDAISANFQVRVSDNADSTPSDLGATNTVVGSMTMTAPTASDVWKDQTQKKIDGTTDFIVKWTYTGSVGPLTLKFDKSGNFSGSERTIATGLVRNTANGTSCTPPGGGGCYFIPGGAVATASEVTNGTTAKFRLIDTASPAAANADTSGFEVRAWYSLTSPSGTGVWHVGDDQTISWTTYGNVPGANNGNIQVQYSPDGGSSGWTNLGSIGATGIADGDGAHSYHWNPVQDVSCYSPNRGCDLVNLRVISVDNTNSKAATAFNMTVLPALTVSVAGTPALQIGSTHNVTWSVNGLLGGTIDVYYSTNNDFSSACNSSTGTGKCTVCSNQTPSDNACSTNPWQIPNNPGTAVAFKVLSSLSTGGNEISYTTSNNNRFYGQFSFSSPTGGTTYSEDPLTISWSTTQGTTTTIPNVKLAYSLDGASWTTIVASTQNDGGFDGTGTNDTGPWSIPEAIVHDNFKVRVTDVNDTFNDSQKISNAVSVPAKLRVHSPNGSETWKIGTSQDVKWAYQGTLSNVDIKYCTDGTITCGSPGTIQTGVTANAATGGCSTSGVAGTNETAGCYRWSSVANARSTTVKVFVADADSSCVPSACSSSRPKVNDGSDANFKIYPAIAVTIPNGGGQWDAGTANNVQFTFRGTMPSSNEKVNIKFSSDGSTFPGTVVNNFVMSPVPDNTVQTYTRSWTTPNTISTSSVIYKVRVQDYDTANYVEAVDDSDSTFDLVARFDITNPTTWRIQDNKTIAWTAAGNVSKVKIRYYTGGIGVWTQITQTGSEGGSPAPTATDGSGFADNTGSFVWRIPNINGIIASDAQIEITDADTGHILRTTASTTNAFNIVPAFTLVQPPQSGATWRATQTRTVQWRVIGLGISAPIKLYYSTNGSSYTEIDNATSKVAGQNASCTLPSDGAGTEGCYDWVIPAGAVSGTAYLKIIDGDATHPASDGDNSNGISSSYIVGAAESITLNTPSGQTFNVNGDMDVAWTASGPFVTTGGVRIEYTTGGGYTTLVANADPDAATGGCTLGANTGCYRVTVPDAISTTFKVRVADKDDGDIINLGNNNTVNGVMANTYSAATVVVDDVINITWTATGSTGAMAGNNTTIEYDKDGQFDGDTVIISTTAVNGVNVTGEGSCTPTGTDSAPVYYGCYKWRIPAGTISDGAAAKIRVTDGGFVSPPMTAFTTTGSITVSSPSSSDVWKAETVYKIDGSTNLDVVWSFKGNTSELGTAKLQFDKTGNFSGSERTIATGLNLESATNGCTDPGLGAGCYRIVAGDLTGNADELVASGAKFRLWAGESAAPNPDVIGPSAGFEVRGWYDFQTPNTGVILNVNDNQAIQWETHGNGLGNVKLQYNSASGVGADGTWTDIATFTAGADTQDGIHNSTWNPVTYIGCYSPERGCDKVRLRIVRVLDTSYKDVNDVDMIVLPKLSLAVAGSPAFQIDSTHNVTWTLDGTSQLGGNVDVYYSTNSDFSSACNSSTGNGKCNVCTSQLTGSLACSSNPWTIPNTPGVAVKFKIISQYTVGGQEISYTTGNNRFYGGFNITAPSGGSNYAGDPLAITWNTAHGNTTTIPRVHIWWSVNDFVSATLINPTVGGVGTTNDGAFDGTGTNDNGIWNLDQTVGHNNFKIRIADADQYDAGGYLESAVLSSAVSVPTKLRLHSPNGSETWKIGSTQDIKWAYKGTVGTIDIKYCTDGTITCGSPGTVQTGVTANAATGGCSTSGVAGAGETAGCYRWTSVANARSTTVKIFIADADAACSPSACTPANGKPKINDGSDNSFKIYPSVIAVTPNTAIQWDAGTSNNMQFSFQGTMPSSNEKVNLLFSSDGGSDGFPGIIQSNFLMSPVPDGTVQTYTKAWVTPGAISTATVKYQVRAQDYDTANYAQATDDSDVSFDLVARFDITNPTTWRIQDNKTIAWSTAGNVNKVKIEYSTAGIGWTQITQTGSEGGSPTPSATDGSGFADNTSSFVWKIPNTNGIIASDAKVRITDADSGHVLRTTPSATNNFNIVPAFTLVQPPQSGVTWRATQTRTVQWRVIGLGISAPIKLYYSTNGSSYTEIDNATSKVAGQNASCTLPSDGAGTEGCYDWVIPAGAVSGTAYLKIIDGDATHPASDGDNSNGISSSYIIGAAESITINLPAGPFTVNGTMDVGWTASGPFVTTGGVKIEYSTNGSSYTTLVANADPDAATGGCTLGANTGCYRVTVPDAVSTTFTVRVSDKDDADIANASTNRTVIGVMVTGNVAFSYTVDDVITITWTATGSTGTMAGNNTIIEYDKDGLFDGDTVNIATTASNGVNVTGEGSCTPTGSDAPPVYYGCYKWRIPAGTISDGEQARIRVTDGGFAALTDTFTVTGSIGVSAPASSDVWKVETQYLIDGTTNVDVIWSFKGNTSELGTVDLKFDKSGSFSGSERTIASGLNLETVNGTGCTDPGTGAGCYRIPAGQVANANELTHGANAAKFRLIAATPNPDVTGTSNAFKVQGWYKITTPAATAIWGVNASKTINWETHGNNIGGTTGSAGSGKILLQYNTNSGSGSWTNLAGVAGTGIADSDSDTNSFSYTVESIDCTNPDQGCPTVRLRIVDYDTSATTATYTDQPGDSGSEFDLDFVPTILTLTPTSSALQIGNSQAVGWTLGGSLGGTVDVFYSTNDDFTSSCNASTGNGKCTVCLDVTASSGACSSNWTIPNITYSSNVKLKIVSDLNANINLTQSSANRIHGKLSLTEPGSATGQSYFSEENITTNITWNNVAGNVTSIPNVQLLYSTNNFSSGTFITSSTANDGSEPWSIPEALIHDNIKVRVADANDTATPADSRGDSANAFASKAKLRIIYPDGGEVLKVGVPVDILWGYKGTLTQVDLKLCTGADSSACASPAVIANDVTSGQGTGCTAPSGGQLQANESGGCYHWTDATTNGAPDLRTTGRIKIFDSDSDTVPSGGTRPSSNDLSGNDFKIVPNIVMLAPNSALKWDANTSNTVQFQVQGTGLNTVDILYSDDSGTSFDGVVQSGFSLSPSPVAGSLTTYNKSWTTPVLISDTSSTPQTHYRVKVEDPDNANFDATEAISAVDFDVVAKFTYTLPTSSSNWQVGSNQTISWNTKGTVNNIKLSFRTNQTSYATIIQTGNEGGTPAPTATNGSGIVTNTGSFVWQVPNTAGIVDTGARIRIEDADTGHVLRTTLDTSSNFEILPKFTMITPAGGETWDAGSTQNIQWRTLGPVSNIKLQYSVNGGAWTDFEDPAGGSITSIPNAQNGGCTLPAANGSETRACYQWKIHPNTIHANVKFRVVDVDSGHPDSTQIAGNGESASFTVQKALTLLLPNGSEQLTVGGNYEIKWEAYGSFSGGTINIQYSGDDFVSDVKDIPNNGSPTNASNNDNGTGCTVPTPTQGGVGGCYKWNPIPNDIRANLKIRVRENVSPNASDASNATFEIVGPLSIVYPNGGSTQNFVVGTDLNILWTNNPNLARETPVDLEYSTNNFGAEDTSDGDGVAGCTVANGHGACQVKNSLGTAAEGLDNTITTVPDGQNGSFSWRIPDTIGNTVSVRVIKQNTPTVGDQSNDYFKIIGGINLSTLNGANALWKMGSANTISWSRVGSAQGTLFNNFRIDFSTDATFATGVTSIDTDVTLAEAGCTGADTSCDFDWTPDATTYSTNISGTPVYYIRVMDPDQNEAVAISTYKFELAGSTTLTTLNAGDAIFKIGTAVPIDWTKSGNQKATYFDNFKIEFSTTSDFSSNVTVIDSDVTFAEASCSTDDTCTYSWTPDAATYSALMSTTADYYLRVYDPDNTDTESKSNPNRFELRGDITLSTLASGADQIYKIGTPVSIDWSKKGNVKNNVFDSFDIQFSTDNTFATGVTTIANLSFAGASCDTDDTCTYSWNPDATTYSAKISSTAVYYLRVLETQNPDTASASSKKFELRGDITLDPLPGNQAYAIGTGTVFTWTKNGNSQTPNFDNFTLQFSTDSTFATGVTSIATLSFAAASCDTDNSCTYTWTPDAATYSSKIIGAKDYYLRVLDVDNDDTAYSSSSFVSNQRFKIMGRIALDPLPGTQLYKVGTPVTFTWLKDGNQTATFFDNFRVQYSTDATFTSGVNTVGTYTFTQAACDLDNSCAISWTPGDTDPIVPNKDYYLRVLDPDDTDTVNSSSSFGSNTKFELAGDLALTILNSNDQTYTVGSTIPITWSKKGTANGSIFDDIDIAYSTDVNFGTSTPISSGVIINGTGTVCDVNGDCTKNWPIPTSATLSSSPVYYARVIDPNNSDSVSVSSFKFKLKGNFTSLSPTVSDKWIIGTDHTFSWTTIGAASNVKISYSTDDFSTEKFFNVSGGKLVATSTTTHAAAALISNTPNGNSSYTMTTPDVISASNFKLRIYDPNDANVFVDSAPFKTHSKFTVTAPGSTLNEIKTATGTTPITWTVAGTVGKAKFEYTLDGSNWSPITSAQSGAILNDSGISSDSTLLNTTRSLTWTLPGSKSGDAFVALVRITYANPDNTTDSDTAGSSANAFKVVAKITVLSPNGENTPFWKVGETDKVITWSTTPANIGGSNQVTLWYSTNGGAWTQIGSAMANDGTEPWNPVPNAVSSTALVRVIDSADIDGSDQSDANFSIAGNLALITPVGGEETFVYSATPAALAVTTPIQWSSQGSAMTNVLLQFSNDNFASDIRPITTITNNSVGTNTFNWPVPDNIGSNWRVRVINNTAGTPAVESVSGSSFKILARFAFTSHNLATDKCLLGNSCTLSWATAGSASNVKVEYSTAGAGGPWSLINDTNSIANGGSVDWNVVSTLSPSTNVRYRITDAQGGHPIPSAGNLEVTDANSKVVAAFPSANIKVSGSTIGGQTWAVGQAVTVSYTYTGIVGSIKVEYSLDDFLNTTDITGSISNSSTNGDGTGSFSYQFTDLLNGGANTTNVKFRILDAAVPDTLGNTTNGVSGGFKLKGVLAVTNPNLGTERWVVGQSATVDWTALGSVSNVKIEYDDNDTFLSPSTIIASTVSTPNVGGTYSFTVNTTNLPDLDTAPLYYKTIYVRISDVDGTGGGAIHGSSNDPSNKAHKIVGKLVLTDGTASPQSGAKWPIGSTQTITWTTFGKVPSVDLYYDDDGLFNGNEVKINATPITNNQGTNTSSATTSYSWSNMALNLPLTATYKIRVVDLGDNTTAESATYKVIGDSNPFKIHGFIDNVVLTSPTGTLKHKASDAATLTWDTTGDNLNSVDLEYRDASGVYLAGAWQTVELAHANTAGNRGTKSWTIPETFNSTNVEVRVKPADGTTDGYDVSAALKFMPKITVTSPINTDNLRIATNFDLKWDIRGVVPAIGIKYKINCPDAPTTCDPTTFTGNPYDITGGSLADLVLDGVTYTKTGANAKLTWNVYDTANAKVRVMIYDPTDASDAYGISDNNANNFKIQGFFTLKAPVAGTELEVYDAVKNPVTAAVTWDWGGTIGFVDLQFSNTYNGTDPATFDAGAKCMDNTAPPCANIPNGSGASGTNFTYNWQVADRISLGTKPYYMRIRDANDPTNYHIFPSGAGNGFKIKAKINITAPVGGENWLVPGTASPVPTYTLSWNNSGTVNNVVIQYSGDNWRHEDINNNNILDPGEDTDFDGFLDRILCVTGGSYPACNAITNDGLFNGIADNGPWKIADDGKLIRYDCNSVPDAVTTDTAHPCKIDTTQIRVLDSGDSNVYRTTPDFTARYVSTKWYIQNAVTGADLDSITMYENSIHKVRGYSNQNVPGLVSPFVLWNPAGTGYDIGLQKVGFTDYRNTAEASTLTDVITGATTEPVEPYHNMIDERRKIFLSDIVAHSDIINQVGSYTAATGGNPSSIMFDVWYTRDGLNVVTTTEAVLIVDNGATNVYNMTTATQTPAGSGVYRFTIANPTLVKGVTYSLRSKIKLPTGTYLQGFNAYSIDQQSESKTTDANVAIITPLITTNVDAKLSTEFAAVKSKIDDVNTAVTTTLNNKIGTDPAGKTLMQKMDDQTKTISDAITDFTAKSDDAVSRMQDEITKGSIRLIVPNTTKVGSTETLRVGTATGVSPVLDLLCPDGTPIVTALGMTESTTPGIYTVDVKFSPTQFRCAVAKAVTIIATATITSADTKDPAFTATAVGSVFLTSTDLDTIQGLAAAGLNAEKAAKDAKDAITKVAKALSGDGNILQSLDDLGTKIDRLPAALGNSQNGVAQMRSTLDEVANQISSFVGKEGYDMRTILKQEIGEGMKGVRNKVDRTLAATKVMKDIMERKVGKSDEPIIQSFYEIGSVKLRVVAVNPSTEKTQSIPIKIYLPKEVIPDDIISMGDLKVGYDSEKSLYYAYSDGVDLAPQETRVFEVHLEDVWKFPDEETNKLREQTQRALKHLKDTPYFDQAKTIVDSIDKRLTDIVTKQNDETVSREEHIGAYRVNQIVMTKVKEDIAILEKMLMHVGAAPSIEFLKDTVFEKKDNIDRITAWKLILAIIGFLGLLGVGFYVRWFFMIKAKRSKSGEVLDAASNISEQVEDGPKVVSNEMDEEAEEVDIQKIVEPDKDKREAG